MLRSCRQIGCLRLNLEQATSPRSVNSSPTTNSLASWKGQVRYTLVAFITCFTRSTCFKSIILISGSFPVSTFKPCLYTTVKNSCCDRDAWKKNIRYQVQLYTECYLDNTRLLPYPSFPPIKSYTDINVILAIISQAPPTLTLA